MVEGGDGEETVTNILSSYDEDEPENRVPKLWKMIKEKINPPS